MCICVSVVCRVTEIGGDLCVTVEWVSGSPNVEPTHLSELLSSVCDVADDPSPEIWTGPREYPVLVPVPVTCVVGALVCAAAGP